MRWILGFCERQHRALAFLVYTMFLSVFLVGVFGHYTYGNGSWAEGLMTVALFSVPFLQILILAKIKKDLLLKGAYALLMLISQGAYLMAWLIYIAELDSALFEVLWLLSAIALVLVSIWTTKVIMSPATGSDSMQSSLYRQIQSNPFLNVSFFLGIFFCVTYLISFSFAFHDRRLQGGALHINDVTLPAEGSGQAKAGDSGEAASGIASSSLQEPVVKIEHVSLFLFSEGEHKVLLDDGEDDPYRILMTVDIDQESDHLKYITAWNNAKLKELVEYVKAASQAQSAQRLLIMLLGHTDDKRVLQPTSNFNSNYELSGARARMVQGVLIDEIEKADGDWPNIEWHLAPMADEGFLRAAHLAENEVHPRIEDRRAVEVIVLPLRRHFSQRLLESGKKPQPRPRKLMDYVYFTIYTITTTGYGDVLPRTLFAKFLASWANLFELFFIVIFFNVLLSTVRGVVRSDAAAGIAGDLREIMATCTDPKVTKRSTRDKLRTVLGKL